MNELDRLIAQANKQEQEDFELEFFLNQDVITKDKWIELAKESHINFDQEIEDARLQIQSVPTFKHSLPTGNGMLTIAKKIEG